MRPARGFSLGLVFCLAAIAKAYAGEPTAGRAERARLAESLLSRAEALAGRAFDARFRAAAHGALSELSGEELESREANLATAGLGPLAIGDSAAQLVYTPVTPCRLVDTRVAGGNLGAGTIREFRVTGGDLSPQGGNAAGCGIPAGPATSAIVNFVAVNPTGAGNLRAWAYSSPPVAPPAASILNYATVSALNIANGIAVPICNPAQTTCTWDLRVQADVNATHLVADVVGYFERFPKEQARSFTVYQTNASAFTGIGSGCTHVPGAAVSITAPVSGRILVQAHMAVEAEHVNSNDDYMSLSVQPDQSTCSSSGPGLGEMRVGAGYPTGPLRITTIAQRIFDVAPGTYSYYLNGVRTLGTAVFEIELVTMTATFNPN